MDRFRTIPEFPVPIHWTTHSPKLIGSKMRSGIPSRAPYRLSTLCLATMAALAFNTAQAQNLVTNPGFENGTTGWFSSGSLTTSGASPHSGSACGSATLGAFGGYVGQSLLGVLQAGHSYTCSAWLRVGSGSPTISMQILEADGSGGSTTTLVAQSLSTTWSLLSTTFTLNVIGTLTFLDLRFTDTDRILASLLLDDVSITDTSPVSVPGPGAATFALVGAWPNPSPGDLLDVTFALPTSAPARIVLLDVGGRRVTGLEVGMMGPGQHSVSLAKGRHLPAGLYFVRLSQGENARTIRVAVLR
jgi:hypothetical protein